MNIEEHYIDIFGLRTRYLTAGSGPALTLLHAAGESATDWQWVMPVLARTHRVYAPDLYAPHMSGRTETTHSDSTYSPDFFARFIAAFLNALNTHRTAIIGNSLGGLIGLCLALTEPSRVTALGLVDSAGLGRKIHPSIIALTTPIYGDLAIALGQTPLGSLQRVWWKAPLLFAHPERIPKEWYMEQYRLAQLPNFLNATLSSLRAQVDLRGQRIVLLDELSRLEVPTLIVWGEHDLVFPITHARNAIGFLRDGHLALIPECGHLPHVEQPTQCAAVLSRFLVEETLSS
jgi:pimeloyl-ACP methyl ester carboxylesterase